MSNMTDNPPWGYSSIIITKPVEQGEDMFFVDWDNTNSKWTDGGSTHELRINKSPTTSTYTATINHIGTGNVVATGYSSCGTTISDGVSITSFGIEWRDAGDASQLWSVEDNSGAAGDPHIKPFFGKDYTI